jgi:conjugal transfer mating pair stabilization protein TraG
MASISRSNGYQISDDMSQVIASRYAEMAASPEFRDLGAPSLTNTTPSPHQREVRNMIVGKILEQYAADGMAPVQAGLQDPAATMGSVRGRLSFPCRRQRHDRRAAAAQDQRQGVSRKARMVHRERADMRRAMMQLGRQFRGGD